MAWPRQKFQEDKVLFKAWADVVDSSPYGRATETALLEMIANMGAAQTGDKAAMSHYRLEGATEILRILNGLANPAVPEQKKETGPPPIPPTLNWGA